MLWLMVGWTMTASAMQDVRFVPGDQRLKVFHGQRVVVLVDSAYVISHERAQLLNEKLLELQQVYRMNEQILQSHQELLYKVREIERLTGQLLEKIRRDGRTLELDLQTVITELDRNIALLKRTNARLLSNNAELQQQLDEMQMTIQHLRKQLRRIWWQSAADKIVIALVAFGLGVGLGTL